MQTHTQTLNHIIKTRIIWVKLGGKFDDDDDDDDGKILGGFLQHFVLL